jgi:hypothetical protein
MATEEWPTLRYDLDVRAAAEELGRVAVPQIVKSDPRDDVLCPPYQAMNPWDRARRDFGSPS